MAEQISGNLFLKESFDSCKIHFACEDLESIEISYKHKGKVLYVKGDPQIKDKLICSKNGEELIEIIRNKFAKTLSHPVIILIDGPIGAGKTSLVNKLKSIFADKVASEELKIMEETAMRYPNELSAFYKDMKSFAFSFELLNISDYDRSISQIKKDNAPCIYLFDRSIISILTFSTLLHQSGSLTKEELDIIYRIFSKYKSFDGVDHIVYIHNDSEELLRRIAKRGRAFEQGIPKSYLDDYNKISEEFGLIKN